MRTMQNKNIEYRTVVCGMRLSCIPSRCCCTVLYCTVPHCIAESGDGLTLNNPVKIANAGLEVDCRSALGPVARSNAM
jgi:hypothetical protein